MNLKNAYLDTAVHAAALLDTPEVGSAWGEPSALAHWSVGGLAGHLAYQVFSVNEALREPPSGQEPISVLEHYRRAVWVDAPLGGIRAKGEDISSGGVRALVERVRAALDVQRARFAEAGGDRVVFLPQTGWALSLDDFLLTRMVELAVHADDLAVSVGIDAEELPDAAFDPVLTVLVRLAARRHGQSALMRALTRAERAPAAINVF